MLTVYPLENYNSYISLLDAESIYDTDIIETSSWDALLSPIKEKYLRQATMLIKLRITDPQSTETPNNIKLATVYLADYAITKNILSDDGNGNLKRISINGAIEKEFFGRGASSTAFPEHVALLLSDYGYSGGGTFSIERV